MLICCGVDGDGIGTCHILEVAVVLAAVVGVVAVGGWSCGNAIYIPQKHASI